MSDDRIVIAAPIGTSHAPSEAGSLLSEHADVVASTSMAASGGGGGVSYLENGASCSGKEGLRILIPFQVPAEPGHSPHRSPDTAAGTPQTTVTQPIHSTFSMMNESAFRQYSERAATMALLQGDFTEHPRSAHVASEKPSGHRPSSLSGSCNKRGTIVVAETSTPPLEEASEAEGGSVEGSRLVDVGLQSRRRRNSLSFLHRMTSEGLAVDSVWPPLQRQRQLLGRAAAGSLQAGESTGIGSPELDSLTVGSIDGGSIGMGTVLKNVSRVRGLRLTWLMYSMILIVIVLFIMFFVQTAVSTDKLLKDTGGEAVAERLATTLNNVKMLHYSVIGMFELIEMGSSSFMVSPDLNIDDAVRKGALCSALFGAPLMIVHYGCGNATKWSIICDSNSSNSNHSLPNTSATANFPEGDHWLREFNSEVLLTSHTHECAELGSSSTLVFLSKEIIGRLLLSNSLPEYSDAKLEGKYTAFVMPTISSSENVIVFHSLDMYSPSYSETRNSVRSVALKNTFDRLCSPHGSSYVWHSVLPSSPDPNDTKVIQSPIPAPYVESHGAWGLASRMVSCCVVCKGVKPTKTCEPDNPDNVWFLVDQGLASKANQTMLTTVGIISIIAVVAFSCLMFITYVSINIPIRVLQYQMLRIAGVKVAEQSKSRKWIIRWTNKLWLGELTSIIRSLNIFGLSFGLNKKYVPDHVLRNHAKELYEKCDNLNFHSDINLDSEAEEAEDDDDDNLLTGRGTGLSRVSAYPLTREEVEHPQWKIPAWTQGLSSHPSTSTSPPRKEVGESPEKPPIFQDDGGSAPYSLAPVVNVLLPQGLGNADGDAQASESHVPVVLLPRSGAKSGMVVKRDFDATLLCIHFNGIDSAYLVNYSAAARQHRRVMHHLLSRIRHYKGAVYHKSGECLGAVWNGFDSCSNHAERAAICAQDIAHTFASFRAAGMQVGIVLHQGPFICGIIEDSKDAFTSAFGEAPRQAMILAELAATQPSFSVVVTEPVKQTLSSLYECSIVDVIWRADVVSPLILFELEGYRPKQADVIRSAVYSEFAVGYAKVFSYFRNHDFAQALSGISALRSRFAHRGEKLLTRLERLSRYYMRNPAALPRPYARPFPCWVNYEASAQAGLSEEPSDPLSSPHQDSTFAQHCLSEMAYHHSQLVHDDLMTFKKELQASVRRVGSPAHRAAGRGESLPQSGFPADSPHSHNLSPTLPTLLGSAPISPRSKNISRPLSNCEDHACAEASSGTAECINESPVALAPVRPAQEAEDVTDAVAKVQSLTQERFSFANSAAPLSVEDGANQSVLMRSDPAVARRSSATAIIATDLTVCSAFQSIGATLRDNNERSLSFTKVAQDLPMEIKAKNGSTYLRSERTLGRGSFGIVYLGMDILSGRLVAIKFLPLPTDEDEMSEIEAEVSIMKRVKDNHVVEFISYAFVNDSFVIVMECMMAGSLQNMISSFRSIPNATARLFIRDVLRGLQALHSMGVIHRDVKPQNVLLSLAGNCKISDFGASSWLHELARKDAQGMVLGTPVYLAPEAARGNPVEESDIWSCGIMFLQLVTGHLPYEGKQLQLVAPVLVFHIGSGMAVPRIPDTLDELDVAFVTACLQTNPCDRKPAQELLQMPLFTL